MITCPHKPIVEFKMNLSKDDRSL